MPDETGGFAPETTTYIQAVVDKLAVRLPDLDMPLLRLYALLVLVKGTATTLEDVHDSWSLWRMVTRPGHPSIGPDGGNRQELAEWCGGNWTARYRPTETPGVDHAVLVITIPTREGVMDADPGDWIIKGVQGEFYPCKPDIFAETYEPAGDAGVACPEEGAGLMRLTVPSAEPGFRHILADGRKVGHVIDIWDDGPGHTAWEAHLGRGGKTLVRKRLADLREDLRVLAEKEPWWT